MITQWQCMVAGQAQEGQGPPHVSIASSMDVLDQDDRSPGSVPRERCARAPLTCAKQHCAQPHASQTLLRGMLSAPQSARSQRRRSTLWH